MAARHEIVHIEFQANAGKANAALDALRMEASKAKTAVDQLKSDLAKAKKANLPIADIEAMEAALKKANSVHKQWQGALNNNLKGVRALDEAIKAFNSGKGSVEGMNAALSKTAKNAAELQKNRSKEGSKTWNEMVALSKALEQNILRCNTATNQLVGTVKSGGTVSRATLTQAKTDLQQMLALENEGTNAWKKYYAQLKVIEGALTKMNVEQQQLAGKNVLAQVFKGEYITKSRTELEQMIAKLREYQGVIADPEGKGARHFNATKDAIAKLSVQLEKTKGDATAVQQALKLAAAANVDTKSSQFIAQQTRQRESVQQLTSTLQQQQARRESLIAQQQSEAAASNQNIRQLKNEANAIRSEVSALDMSTQAIERRKAELATVGTELEKQLQKEKKLQEQYARTAAVNQTSRKGIAVSNQLFATQKEITSLAQKQSTLQKEIEIVNRLREAENRLAGAQQLSTIETEKGTVVTKDYLTHLQIEAERARAEAAAIDTSTEAMKRREAELKTLGAQLTQAQQKEKQLQDQYNRMSSHGKKGQKISRTLESTRSEISALQQRKAVLEGQVSADGRLQAAEEKVSLAMRQAASVASSNAAAIAQLDGQINTTTAQLNNETAALNRLNQAENMTIQEVTQAIAVLKQEQEVTGTTTAKFKEQAAAIAVLEEREKIMRGEALSLADALKLASTAGGKGFQGTAQQLGMAQQAIEKAASSAKKGNAEWKKYQDALAKLKVEMQNTGMTSERMRAIMDKPANAKNLNELSAAVKRAKAELDLMAGTVGKNSAEYTKLASQTKKAEIQLKQLQSQSHGTASAFEKAWSRLKTYISLYMGAAVAIQKIVGTFGDLMELSDKMGEVRKTTGFAAEEVGLLSENLAKMDTRTSLTGLMDLSVAAGQLGLKTQEDVLGFTEAANKLMVALPEMGKEGATEMLKVALATGEIDKIRKQMEQGIIDGSSATAVAMEKVGSTIDRLRATSAATAPAITDFVKRVGAVGAQSGISIDQVAALGSTVDALGMRVEMSATALSRMLPAIKNNAFDIAKILGVTPNSIRELYDAGRGMEVILMIFQHIKDAGMDADSIEGMLGMGGMKEIMKELNQQGARAGIVFGGLSQNVDELRRQLGVAAQAYKENIAIQQEYDKMNETTAAKWERLKNYIEELFVGDTAQRWLGNIIDGLRWIVEVITGEVGPAWKWLSGLMRTFLVYWGIFKLGLGEALLVKTVSGLKNMGSALINLISNTKSSIIYTKLLKKANLELAAATTVETQALAKQKIATIEARMAQRGLNKEMLANVWMALAAAILYAATQLWGWIQAQREGAREAARFQAELDKEQRKVDDLTDKIGNARVKIEEADKAIAKARAELDAAKKANDGTTEAVKRLTKAEAELLDKEEQKKNAMAEHKRLIEDFNTQYSKYLGFMLSEVSSNYELANARQLVNDKLRETLTLKQQEAAIERVENKKGEKRDEEYATLYDFVGKNTRNDPTARPAIMSAVVKAANSAKDQSEFRAQIVGIFKKYNIGTLGNALNYYESVKGIRDDIDNQKKQFYHQRASDRQQSQKTLSKQAKAAEENYNALEVNYKNATGENKKRAAAALLQQMDTIGELVDNASGYYDISYPGEESLYRRFKSTHGRWYNNRRTQRDSLLREAGKYYTPRKKVEEKPGSGSSGSFTTGSSSTSGYVSPSAWGDDVPADSTEYSEMSVEELVARRKQMNKFKNVLKPGIDIRAVLAEDKALMKAIDSGKVGADWESVLGWYNTERKKIQQELKSERFSTNEGNWRDEKTNKGRKRRVNPLLESDYALAELDRYYSRRKETLEKARIEENLSEEAFNRQAELLEQEHLEKRSKLRATFTDEVSKKETAAFRKWWDNLEKMNELDEVSWATVESEWAKATAAQIGRNNYRMQKDLTDMRMITVKHLNAIAKIIAKERPYDAITDNLRKNLTDMGILFADMEKDGGIMDTRKLVQAQARRMTALMEMAEDAYSLTSKELMDRLRIQEYTHEWALAIEDDDTLVNALMAQLHKAYDEIQNAIQKEANIIKKQSEIIWKNAVPELGNRSRKDTFEGILSAMGLEEDRVKRANELIGAGQASERVADRLAIKQMQIRLMMEEHYYNLMQAKGEQRIAMLLREKDAEEEKAKTLQEQAKTLREQGREEEAITAERKAQEATQKSLQAKFDAQHAAISLNLSMSEEQKKIDEQRVEIANRLEESQNRLYKYMREWGELVVSSAQSIFEASHAGDAEYYNERAKMNLTGKGGPGAGTYIVIDNEGTSSAKAHYEYLSEAEALERQHEIERENAKAEAWKKVMDDLNMKMSDMITDQINAMLQNAAVNANTKAVEENTAALEALNRQSMKVVEDNADVMNEAQIKKRANGSISFGDIEGETEDHAEGMEPMKIKTIPGTETPDDTYNGISNLPRAQQKRMGLPVDQNPYDYTQGDVVTDPMSAVQAEINADNVLTETVVSNAMKRKEAKIEASNEASDVAVSNSNKEAKVTTENDKKEQTSKQSMFAKMTAAANLYGVAYQAMSNDNLDMAQKFEMIALQAVGNAAIAGLQVALSSSTAETATNLPPAAAKSTAEAGPIVGPILFAALSALVGGLMGLAASKVAKSKSQIAQVTGASVGAGRLATGMLTYAEGNVNELTDPASLTPGRSYNVDGRDGKTYRAKYMGVGARTHITSGPEFHLVGEAGREAIIDAKTTRNIRMNEPDIWRSIQTLYNGGSLRHTPARRRRGVRAFADGNIEDFDKISQMGDMDSMGIEGIQAALDRNSAVQEALLERLQQPIYAQNILYGADGLPNVIAKLQKEAKRHGVKYL